MTTDMSQTDYQEACMKAFGAVAAVLILTALLSINPASANDQDPCVHGIVWGETLTSIADNYGTTVADIVALNNLTNPDLIIAGTPLHVCASLGNGPRLLQSPEEAPAPPALAAVELPGQAQAWARAVKDTRPDWATDQHELFLVAVAKYESSWGVHLWNPRDAGWENGVQYIGSYGVVQIRVRADGHGVRNRPWLEQSLGNQATAAWQIFGDRYLHGVNPYRAWGPANWTRRGTVPPKLPPSPDDCWSASSPRGCRNAYDTARLALALS